MTPAKIAADAVNAMMAPAMISGRIIEVCAMARMAKILSRGGSAREVLDDCRDDAVGQLALACKPHACGDCR
jgi:hypothetical protein